MLQKMAVCIGAQSGTHECMPTPGSGPSSAYDSAARSVLSKISVRSRPNLGAANRSGGDYTNTGTRPKY